MSNVFESINEDAQLMADKYTHLQLKTYYAMIEDLSDYDNQVLSGAIEIHRKRLREKLSEEKVSLKDGKKN